MARLHGHGRRWHPPPGAELPVFDHPPCGDPDLLSAAAQARGHGPVVAAAMRRSAAAYDVALASDVMLPIHGDLHGGNLKWDGSRFAVFDFDDCGMSVPVVAPAFRGDADAYLEVAIERLARWLETGVLTLGAPWG